MSLRINSLANARPCELVGNPSESGFCIWGGFPRTAVPRLVAWATLQLGTLGTVRRDTSGCCVWTRFKCSILNCAHNNRCYFGCYRYLRIGHCEPSCKRLAVCY
ncbi:hypothetical protein ABW19_dt0204785 [Dactylella cylindrospora]|nr:hypothetical protein ABW19_dt0204785 [Dactylella cylindrospora]